jgi:hypothetical protein
VKIIMVNEGDGDSDDRNAVINDNVAANESSLSVVGNTGLTATATTTAATTTAASSSSTATTTTTTTNSHHPHPTLHRKQSSGDSLTAAPLDFIGSSHAVKNLFSIPFSNDQTLCVAVHNLGGTLLLDVDEEAFSDPQQQHYSSHTSDKDIDGSSQQQQQQQQPLPPSSQSLALALSSPLPPTTYASTSSNPTAQDALARLSHMLQQQQQQTPSSSSTSESSPPSSTTTSTTDPVLPYSEHAIAPPAPREYLPWAFQDMNLLVGSDALIVRDETSTTALAVRVEEASDLRRVLQQHETNQTNISSSLAKLQAAPAPGTEPVPVTGPATKSYAQALTTAPLSLLPQSETEAVPEEKKQPLDMTLQTCIVPSWGPIGGLLGGPASMSPQPSQSSSQQQQQSTPPKTPTNPVCVVLDAYLDNLMANVPQLALCLREQGFIQSVKLLQTQDIPSLLLQEETLDTSQPIHVVNNNSSQTEQLFSPQIMEMNASALLRFLQANCTKDNATYMLRRQAGDSNIQLYDISAISKQRQRQWAWWLATMSHRFALRLRQLEHSATSIISPAQRRSFRDRQRSLYQTTLDLLEELVDMDGTAHESLVASVNEHYADTYLGSTSTNSTGTSSEGSSEEPPPPPSTAGPQTAFSTPPSKTTSAQPPQQKQHPYHSIPIDGLNKALDRLVNGISALWPVLQKNQKQEQEQQEEKSSQEDPLRKSRRRKRAGSIATPQQQTDEAATPDSEAIALQLFGLHYKLINVLLRMAEHHLRNYFSSSAMQALRTAARRMADSGSLLEHTSTSSNTQSLVTSLQLQYMWLWENCGHFARSFASDELWRDRGHACGDDIISVLRDVEAAFPINMTTWSPVRKLPLSQKTQDMASLQSVSAIVGPNAEAALTVLGRQRQLQRDKRQVLVASCISYSRAISEFEEMVQGDMKQGNDASGKNPAILNLLRQRLGDASNETGKVLLAALRTLLGNPPKDDAKDTALAAESLLLSAQFWFMEGLEAFQASQDLRNLALLRCNLCQCYKLRANSSFAATDQAPSGTPHAEVCLQEAANHLQAAHVALGTRDVDPMTWDMVSEELAATFLVLGVRRRQTLLGGGNTPVTSQALRLSPGKERSIAEPMERALEIYEQSGNVHQAAAVHYQLALTFSKVWTCQRDETKTREKLSSAFKHYNMAFAYFKTALRGNEPTFCLLCLDLASLYAAVSGEECLTKALARCLDTYDAFSQGAIDAATASVSKDWMDKMETLASSVEDRVFKLLRSLVKLESGHPDRYKELYRVGLIAKMVKNVAEDEADSSRSRNMGALHDVLVAIKGKFDEGQ